MPERVGLDFETYGGTSLPDYGLYNYVSCSSFQPLIASVSVHTGHGYYRKHRFPLYDNNKATINELRDMLYGRIVVAHNAPFEQWVLRTMGIEVPSIRFIDSAVVARAMGAGGKLEAAAPQLLGVDKLEDGKRLIRLFSIPGAYQEKNDSLAFDPAIVDEHPEDWEQFGVYCDLDSELGLRIVDRYIDDIPYKEIAYNAVTMDMNATGWHVDVALVEEMQRRYLENVEMAEAQFRAQHDAHELNFNSLKQMKEWCAERGIKATSFDEKNVAKLIARIEKKLSTMAPGEHAVKACGYHEVLALLETKQILGGSSLKKLQTILDTTGKDCRLRDQYLHIGAGQTYRTTGKGVQMQNLKRLDGENIADMDELLDLEVEWDNEKLAENIRQCFTASDPGGALIVGDFSSVESRGLAWLAGASDKLRAFRDGLDVYKVGASKQYGVAYDDVTKSQRQFGKVGELSCGYQAGGGAVQSFAEGMGVHLTEGEASQLVTDWRAANPEIVQLWWDLDDALNGALDGKLLQSVRVGPLKDWRVRVYPTDTPSTLIDQHPGAKSLGVTVVRPDGTEFLTRVFHGCYRRGRNICYYKPSELKSGDLWKSNYTDQKTKQVRFYSIYGGKLAGILTQSFCREIFFGVLRQVHAWCGSIENLQLVGQFHDEIVLDWQPSPLAGKPGSGFVTRDDAKAGLDMFMSETDIEGFPLAAEVKHDYRYTK